MSTELPSFGQCAAYHCSMHSEEPLSVSKLASSCLLRGKECIFLDKKGSEVGVSALLKAHWRIQFKSKQWQQYNKVQIQHE